MSKSGRKSDVTTAGCGFLMGTVDVIPGVSGGTMALILGIYERLVTAVSRFDLTLFGHVKRGDFRAAAAYLDLRFLVALGVGIVVAFALLSGVLKWLLANHVSPTYGLFFGLITASSYLVAKMVRKRGLVPIGALALGALVAYQLTAPASGGTILPFSEAEVGEPVYIFLCGAIAICAMILPGISGSYLLLLLGKYNWMLDVIDDLKSFSIGREELAYFGLFGAGCVTGIIVFSKFLRWLLKVQHDNTVALLCGFMIGSLRMLWPYKDWVDRPGMTKPIGYNRWPENFAEAWLPALLGVVGVAVVLALTRIAHRGRASA